MACGMRVVPALAFPDTDVSNPGSVPVGADLSQPDVLQLQHQMGLASGFNSLGSAQGWTILPRISGEEQFTDNVLELPAPRRWDLTTIVAPGVAVLGNSDRAQLRLNYEPDLEIHLRTGSQNVLAQQLNAVGTLTVVPDLVFIDVRGVAGTQATDGGVGGLGGLGDSGIGGVTGSSLTPTQPSPTSLSKQNRSETASVSVSPYMLYQFGDTGTGRVGASFTRATSSQLTGFAPLPFAQGTNSQSMSTVEENAQFTTGSDLSRLRDTFTADASQSTSTGVDTTGSTRATASNRLDYQINTAFDVYGQLGYEDITYTGSDALDIHDVTWGAGTVYTPNPDTQVSLGYGHQNGANSLNASAHYAITARTVLTASYTNGVGTQLEQVSQQLNQAAVGNNGSLVNAQTGGQLFGANNALGVEPGVYRYNDLTVGLNMVLNRDTVTVTTTRSEQTRVGNGVATTGNTVTTASASWVHQLSSDLLASATVSYSIGSPLAGTSQNSLFAGLSLQYILSDTVSTFARYNFYNVQSSAAGQSWYQDTFLVGITKQF